MRLVEPALVERAITQARLDLRREPGRRGIVEHVGQGLEHDARGVDRAAYQQVAPDPDLGRHDLGAVGEPAADLLGDREVVEHLGVAVPEEGARADGALRPDHELGQVALVALGHRCRQLQRTVEQAGGPRCGWPSTARPGPPRCRPGWPATTSPARSQWWATTARSPGEAASATEQLGDAAMGRLAGRQHLRLVGGVAQEAVPEAVPSRAGSRRPAR